MGTEQKKERGAQREREIDTITHHGRVEHLRVCEGERIADKQGTLGRLQHTHMRGQRQATETGNRRTHNICQAQKQNMITREHKASII